MEPDDEPGVLRRTETKPDVEAKLEAVGGAGGPEVEVQEGGGRGAGRHGGVARRVG
ncbi:MAG: hypothetical protein IPG72_04730 [Ardenticatenales bacterium]|nr:hypothetical protein [Ardenticatenales bacterium]